MNVLGPGCETGEWLQEDYFIFHVRDIEGAPSASDLLRKLTARRERDWHVEYREPGHG